MRRGRWLEPTRSWNDTSVIHCEVCGRLIPRRMWMFEGGAGELQACSPECEDLYDSYLKPTYGVIRKDAHRKS